MSSFRFTQLSFASEIKDWMNSIIKNLGLRFEYADIEVKDPARKRADVILWEKRTVKPALLLEIWDAKTDPWGYALNSALEKAWKNNIPYFVVWNLTHFYCWDTFAQGGDIDKLWWPHSGVSEVVCEALTYDDAILRYNESIKKYLEIFLREFEEVYYGIKAKPLLGIDERFIYRLRGAIHAVSIPILENIKRMATQDANFRRDLVKYFREQGWSFRSTDEDFEKVARQYVYLFVTLERAVPLSDRPTPEEITGNPLERILRGLHYPHDGAAVRRGDQYLWGRDILVAPEESAAVDVLNPGRAPVRLSLTLIGRRLEDVLQVMERLRASGRFRDFRPRKQSLLEGTEEVEYELEVTYFPEPRGSGA